MKNIQLKKIIREIILEERSLSFDDFKKIVNGLRKKNKNKWYQWIGTVENKKVRLKGYNT